MRIRPRASSRAFCEYFLLVFGVWTFSRWLINWCRATRNISINGPLDLNYEIKFEPIFRLLSRMTQPNLGDLPVLPLAQSFALTAAYHADTSPEKVNLGKGVYRDENCRAWVLPSVQKVVIERYKSVSRFADTI